ncbi:MAG TPA: hypothetical protein VGQ45_02665 [Gaiellales bacterium]|nr:hypothetical protein [Gaiellales bacterium]
MAAVAVAGMVLGFWLLPLASGAQISGAGHPRAGAPRAVEWAGFAGDAQHTAVARTLPQPFRRIRWRAKVDLAPVLSFGTLGIHYGSPMITAANTVLVPTRVSTRAGFRVVAYSGSSGARRWSLNTDWRPPAFTGGTTGTWTPPLPAVLTPRAALAVAGGGGTILVRRHANKPVGAVRRLVFYGAAQWRAHRPAYDKAVQITTPLTAAPNGSVYFGFTVTGSTPAHLSSGIARIDAHGHATWITAAAAAGNPAMTGVALNCAPALSPSGKTLYITVTSPTRGILVGLNATTLKPRFHALLKDPVSGRPAVVLTSSSASPTVGPDGDVYYGVLENPFPSHDDRGWLLHFNATLTRAKTPGSFGWDNTVSVLPARAVPGYHGTSPYLLVSKYNNYLGIGPHGDGHNRVAVLDPRSSQKDAYADTRVMKAVQTILSPQHEPGEPPGTRYEWCINSAVVDPADDSVIVNSEDGTLYRWDLATNTLAERIHLNRPRPEAYTPTLIGPDGTVYAINNATLYAIGR